MKQNIDNFKLSKTQIQQLTLSFKEGEVLFQVVDELMEVAEGEKMSMLIEIINNAPSVCRVARDISFDKGYDDLAMWSNDNDILLLAEYDVLICLPKNDYSEIIYGQK